MSNGTAEGARIIRSNRTSWTNWHQNVTQDIAGLFDIYNPDTEASPARYRETVATVQSLLADAKSRDIRVRALGGGWSFSHAPATEGWMINTKPLNWVFGLSAASVDDAYAGARDGLVLVQCGVSIAELNAYLETHRGRSLVTVGASNGQTFAGAMSTGTHGSAIDHGAIQDHVVGLHLLAGPSRQVWLERESEPVVSAAFVERVGATLVRDDRLFDATLVGFGGFGVVFSALIETGERFLLEAHRGPMPWNDSLRTAIDTQRFDGLDLPGSPERPYFFQAVVNPHDLDGGAHVTSMYRRPFPDGYVPNYDISGGLRPGFDLLGVIAVASDTVPELTPLLVSLAIGQQLSPFSCKKGTLGEIFDFTTPRGHAAGAGLGVPVDQTTRVIDILLDVHARVGPAPLAFACRFVRRSKGLLAFTRHEPATCVIDIDGALSNRTDAFYEEVWRTLDAEGVAYTQHWGKINGLDPSRLRRMYGEAVDAWLAARHELLDTPADRRLFSSPFLERAGLAG